MRKIFDSVCYLNLKTTKQVDGSSDSNNYVFFPMNNKLTVFQEEDNNNTKGVTNKISLKKVSEIEFDDEILDFHILNSTDNLILIIGRNNKKVCLFNSKNEKISE